MGAGPLCCISARAQYKNKNPTNKQSPRKNTIDTESNKNNLGL